MLIKHWELKSILNGLKECVTWFFESSSLRQMGGGHICQRCFQGMLKSQRYYAVVPVA